MNINDMLISKYLKKDDVGDGVTGTIQRLEKRNVALDDQPAEEKWLLHLAGIKKPLILNGTNIQLLAKAFGKETADWMGKEVELYVDDGVTYAGALVGGIRLRSAKPKTKAAAMAAVADLESDRL